MSEFSWPIRVYYEDTDAGGVVYHTGYIRFFERGRTEWLRDIGHEQADLLRDPGIGGEVADGFQRQVGGGRLGHRKRSGRQRRGAVPGPAYATRARWRRRAGRGPRAGVIVEADRRTTDRGPDP